MKKYRSFLLIIGLALSCVSSRKQQQSTEQTFNFQAHRGGRGLMPENTIAAMLNALDFDRVKTLEMDVVISKDGQVLVSHDPYFNSLITTTPEGKFLNSQEAIKTILFQMDYETIRKYDVGLKPHPDFPDQKKLVANKPLLSELIDSVEQKATAKKRTIEYNIEIKSKKATDNINHPIPEIFVDKLIAVLRKKKILDKCVIQSFDTRPLQEIHKRYPSVKTSFLVDKNGGDQLDIQLMTLGYIPEIYSPVSTIVSQQLVDACHRKNMKIIPWTVNNVDDMQKLVDLGVDGLISDYPDLFSKIKTK